jgi:hypothetical protein
MSRVKFGRRRPLPHFDHAARLRVGRGKARFLIQRADAQHNATDMRSPGVDFPHTIPACQKCDVRDVHAKKRVCLRRLASWQFRRMGGWIWSKLWKRMYRLKKVRMERSGAKEFIHRRIASSVQKILTESGYGELADEDQNGLDLLD